MEDEAFFNSVFVDEEIETVTWKGILDLDPDVLYEESIPLNEVLKKHPNFFDKGFNSQI